MDLAIKIISLSLAAIVIILMSIFFIRKKSPAMLCIAIGVFLLFIATYLAEWFGLTNLILLQQITFLACVFFTVCCIIVYENDIKNIFARAHRLHWKNEQKNITDEEIRTSLRAIVTACQAMSKSRTHNNSLICP